MKCITRLLFISLIASSLVVFYSCNDPVDSIPNDGITTKFAVDGMTCAGCENALRGALENKSKYPLIYSVEAEHGHGGGSGTCTVVHDKKMSQDEVKNAINATKFRVKNIIP